MWSGWGPWMIHNNKNSFNILTPTDKPRKPVSHFMLGFSREPEEFLGVFRTDMNRSNTDRHEIQFEYKRFQAWHTNRRLVLLNPPTKIPMASIRAITQELFEMV